MKVCLLVGSRSVRFCGVMDYASRLAHALCGLGVEAQVWGLTRVSELRAARFDVVHVQYPAIGFRYSLVPMWLGAAGVARCVCVTLHEFGEMPLAQRVAMQAFRFTARGLVFTTAAERARFGSAKSRVIGIGSNVTAPAVSSRVREAVIVYFGQVRPGKGLEAFIAQAAAMPHFRFQVLGAEVDKHREYLDALRSRAAANVEWLLDQALPAVAERMECALAAYLPFPDGATLKRGSLLGAMVCGAPVVTTVSTQTPSELADVILRAQTIGAVQEFLDKLQSEPRWAAEVGDRGRQFARQFSWDAIAAEHLQFYEEMLNRGG